ncbi:MAG TPA: FimV/HubP family polar landmark protein, partial [Burkholderiales bacterium]|nr:FimV/HubP family polar landmark protein [Burkholderiales bacterium]
MPCAANAAGLGRLTILSGLGQPLNAEIELVSPQKGETLTARLSPIDLYQQAKLPYNPALAGARVSVERRANGQPYVKVVTSSNVSEPFAELLIELNSESGRITRQYTLLLDPPGYGRAAGELAPPTPAVADAPARLPAAQSAPAVRNDAASKAAAPSAAVGGGVAEGAPVRGSTPIIKPAPQVTEAQGGAKQYGPIKPGETLGRIARAVRPEGATLEQTLVGLYRQNPEAFIKKNMNLVKSGRILKVPEAAELTALAQRDAVREVRLQSADFESFRNRVADRAGTVPDDGGVASGRIGARIAGREAPEPRDTVRVSRGEPSAQTGTKGGPERLRTLEEEAVAREKALAEANERIAQLEKSIKDMQRLADLKKPAAAAPAQTGSPTSAPASTTSSTSTSTGARPAASATPPTPATTATPTPSTPAATSAPTPSATTPTLSLDTQPLPGPLALASPQSAPAAAASGPTSVAANSAPLDVHKAPSPIPLEGESSAASKSKSPVAAAPAARPDLLTQILREPLYLAAGGIVLLGGVLMAMRRRRGSRAPAFKAETTGPGLRSGGNDLSARLAQAETARTQKKAEPRLASAAAPLVAAPTAAIASQERPTSVPSPSEKDADGAVAARASSEGEDNDLDFQAATPVTEATATPKAAEPDAPSVTPAPTAAPLRASESA